MTTAIQVVYEVTDDAIALKRGKYALLKADTPQGYEQVRLAIADLRETRGAIEKRRKELKADSLEYGRKVDAVAKHLTEQIEAIEKPLKDAKAAVDEEKARIKAEKEAAAQKAIEDRLRAEREAEEARLKAEADRLAQERAALDAERAALNAQRQAVTPETAAPPLIAQVTESPVTAVLRQIKGLIAELEAKAKRKAWFDSEENNAMDNSGGNFDDAYEGGCRDGETSLARELVPRLLLLRNELEAQP